MKVVMKESTSEEKELVGEIIQLAQDNNLTYSDAVLLAIKIIREQNK